MRKFRYTTIDLEKKSKMLVAVPNFVSYLLGSESLRDQIIAKKMQKKLTNKKIQIAFEVYLKMRLAVGSIFSIACSKCANYFRLCFSFNVCSVAYSCICVANAHLIQF